MAVFQENFTYINNLRAKFGLWATVGGPLV